MKRAAFSLIELMVVVAIISVLAAIAVPAYNTYTTKTNIVKAISELQSIAADLQTTYQTTGSFPSSLKVAGVTIPNVSWAAVNIDNIAFLSYTATTGGAMIQGSLTGLTGIPGYVAPSGGNTHTANSVISYSVIDIGNGIIKTYCGQYADANAIPLAYLPGACQCTNVFDTNTC